MATEESQVRLPWQTEVDEFLKTKSLLPDQTKLEIDQFVSESINLDVAKKQDIDQWLLHQQKKETDMAGIPERPPEPEPPPQLTPEQYQHKIQESVRAYMEDLGPESFDVIPGETPEQRMEEAQKLVADYQKKPGFKDQILMLSQMAQKRDPAFIASVIESVGQGVTLGNLEHIVNIAGKVADRPDLWQEYQTWKRGQYKDKFGFEPDPEVMNFLEAPHQMAAAFAPISLALKGATVGATALTKIPALQSVARGTITGIVTGLVSKPEDEGLVNRLKQVPPHVLFFTALDVGMLTASQMARIVQYNRAFKRYGKVNWDAPPTPPGAKPFTKAQMRELYMKMQQNSVGRKVPLTETEEGIINLMKESNGWNKAVKEGWIKPKPEWATTGEPAFKPRKPRITDIFREPGKIPKVEGKPFEVPPTEAPGVRPAPPRPEVRPEAIARPRPLVTRPVAREGPIPTVDVTPKRGGGWTYRFDIPTEQVPVTAREIPFYPSQATRFLEGPAEAPKAKPKVRKEKKFKDPIYQYINFHYGAVQASPDFSLKELRSVLPFDITSTPESGRGVGLDVIAADLTDNGFPTIERSDVELFAMLEDIKNNRQRYKDMERGETYEPTPEDVMDFEGEPPAEEFVKPAPARKPKPEELFEEVPPVVAPSPEPWQTTREEAIQQKKQVAIPSHKEPDVSGPEVAFAGRQKDFVYRGTETEEEIKHIIKNKKIESSSETARRLGKKEHEGMTFYSDRPHVASSYIKRDGYLIELDRSKVPGLEPQGAGEFSTKHATPATAIKRILKVGKDKDGVYAIDVTNEVAIPEAKLEVPVEEAPKPTKPKPKPPEKRALTPEEEKTLINVFDEMKVPIAKRGEWGGEITRTFDRKVGPIDRYARFKVKKLRLEERRVKAKEVKVEPLPEEIPEEGVATGKVEKPETRFTEEEEEIKIRKIIFDSVKKTPTRNAKRDEYIALEKILGEKSFEQIGASLPRIGEAPLTRARVEQIFSGVRTQMMNVPEFQEIAQRRWKQHNLGPIPSGKSWDDFKVFAKKHFTREKGVDVETDKAADEAVNRAMADFFMASHEAKTVQEFLDKHRNPALEHMVLDTLKGEIDPTLTALPDEIIGNLVAMRRRIDDLSGMIMSEVDLADPTWQKFEANVGRYLGRFYRAWEQRKKRWKPPQDVKDRFKAMLKETQPERFRDWTDDQLEEMIDALVSKSNRDPTAQIRVKKGKKTIPLKPIFGVRKDLPKEYRELIGEFYDPVYLFLKTVAKQSTAAYNAQFLNKIGEIHPELIRDTYDEAAKMGWQENQLGNTYAYGKLRGKYVSDELFKYIKGEMDPQSDATEAFIFKFLLNPYKATKTIGSIPTQARNFFSNWGLSFLGRNSIFNPLNAPYYVRAANIFLNRNTTEKEIWAKLIKEGVSEIGYYGHEVPRFTRDLLDIDPKNWADKIWDWATATPKYVVDKAGQLYNFNDVLFRISTYLKYTEKFGMTPKEAVSELDDVFQNYRKLPPVVDWLRKYPVFGPFVSFQWNIGYNMVKQAEKAGKEFSSKDPKTKWKGAKRLWRLLAVLMFPTMMSELSIKLSNLDGEKLKKLERHYPIWRRNGTFVYFWYKDKLKQFDLTFMYPTGAHERAVRSIIASMKGDPQGIKSFSDAVNLFAHPVFDVWSIMAQGRDPYWGTEISGGFWGKMAQIAKTLWIPASAPIPSVESLVESIKGGKFQPRAGSLTPYQIETLIRAYYQEPDAWSGDPKSMPEELKNFFTGIRTWTLHPEDILAKAQLSLRNEIGKIDNNLRNYLQRNIMAPDWEVAKKMAKYDKKLMKLYEEYQDLTELYDELLKGEFLLKKE